MWEIYSTHDQVWELHHLSCIVAWPVGNSFGKWLCLILGFVSYHQVQPVHLGTQMATYSPLSTPSYLHSCLWWLEGSEQIHLSMPLQTLYYCHTQIFCPPDLELSRRNKCSLGKCLWYPDAPLDWSCSLFLYTQTIPTKGRYLAWAFHCNQDGLIR